MSWDKFDTNEKLGYLLKRSRPSTKKYTPLTGTTIVLLSTKAAVSNILLVPAGTIASLTVTLPASSYDGQVFNFATKTVITALTINGGQASGAPTSATANGFFSLVYSSADSTWYRIS